MFEIEMSSLALKENLLEPSLVALLIMRLERDSDASPSGIQVLARVFH
jgi:hypothetical protein